VNATNTANMYKNQQIMTAAPEELTLMLYNGAIRFVTESIQALQNGDLPRSNTANQRVQDIVKEFMSTINMDYEMSKGLFSLYEYMNYRLVQANLKKDVAQLEEVKGMLIELRNTWVEAIKKVRMDKVVGK
jgi:flagellar protein FliS